MTGSVGILALVLLAAGSGDAGMATVSDKSTEAGVSVAADCDKATPVNYVIPLPEGDVRESKKPSLMQAMLQDQDRKESRKESRKDSPFKDEESADEETAAAPPANLPSNPPAAPTKNALAGTEWAGYGDSDSCGCTADSCQSKVVKRGPMTLRNWFSTLDYDAWIDQGVTINTFSPRNRSNFPVGFNNRSNEYQLNQAYLRLKRDVNTQDCRWDVGATVDLLYGTDSAYTSSRGLEVNRDFSPKWNSQQYGLSMPQCYMEIFAPWGEQGMTMKLGHFYTILGYETACAPENFFYSHSYSLIYGEPVVETGLLAEKKLGNFKIHAGMTRGWDNWEDNNNDMSFMGGLSWASDDNRTSLAAMVQAGPEQNEPPENKNSRTVFSLVYQQKMGQRMQYVMQYDYGQEDRDDILGLNLATWFGLSDYVFYTINDRWKAGLRFEWFRDRDGVRLTNGVQGADYFELSAGLNWTPNSRVAVRPEIRYDWDGTPNYTPFADNTRSGQLILDCDVIVKF